MQLLQEKFKIQSNQGIFKHPSTRPAIVDVVFSVQLPKIVRLNEINEAHFIHAQGRPEGIILCQPVTPKQTACKRG